MDVFALQAALAREIADALGATLLPTAETELARVPTESEAAYELFLRARGTSASGSETSAVALGLLEQAVELDPSFALAWALYTDRSAHAYQYGYDRTENRLAVSLEAAETALELEPDLPEANLALGLYYYRTARDYPRALGHITRASRLRPGWARAAQVEGWIARRDGRFEVAVEKHRQAADLDPRNWDVLDDLAQTLTYTRQYEEADELFGAAWALGPVDLDAEFHRAQSLLFWRGELDALREIGARSRVLGEWYPAILSGDSAALGQFHASASSPWMSNAQATLIPTDLSRALHLRWIGADAASQEAAQAGLDLLEPRIATDPSDGRARASAGWAYAFLGRADDAVREADLAVELARNDTYRTEWAEQLRLWTHATLGNAEGAATTFERMVSLPGLGWSVEGLLSTRLLDSVRNDPVFMEAVERLRAEGR